MTIEQLITAIENRINDNITCNEHSEAYQFLIPYHSGVFGTVALKEQVHNTPLNSFKGEQLITYLATWDIDTAEIR